MKLRQIAAQALWNALHDDKFTIKDHVNELIFDNNLLTCQQEVLWQELDDLLLEQLMDSEVNQ